MAAEKKVSESKTEATRLMFPRHANPGGFIYGGAILSMADSIAYICAARHAGPRCVTVAVDRVDFREPIRIGQAVTFKASVNWVGRSSMEIGIRIEAEDLASGVRRHTNSCYFTMVAVDERGQPKEVPRLIRETEVEEQRFKSGALRRKLAKETQLASRPGSS